MTLSYDEVIIMINNNDFFDFSKNERGRGFRNNFEIKKYKNNKVIIDKASDLIWQRSGSAYVLTFDQAKNWIEILNQKKYFDKHEWRLPTLEEAMSFRNRYSSMNINPCQVYNTRLIRWHGLKYSHR